MPNKETLPQNLDQEPAEPLPVTAETGSEALPAPVEEGVKNTPLEKLLQLIRGESLIVHTPNNEVSAAVPKQKNVPMTASQIQNAIPRDLEEGLGENIDEKG